jgi:hypothetical protein
MSKEKPTTMEISTVLEVLYHIGLTFPADMTTSPPSAKNKLLVVF